MNSDFGQLRENIFNGIKRTRGFLIRAFLLLLVLGIGGLMISKPVIDKLSKPVQDITRVYDQPILTLPSELARKSNITENEKVRLKFPDGSTAEAVVKLAFSSGIVFTAPAEAFVIRIKVAAVLALMAGFPVLLWGLIGLFTHRIPPMAMRALKMAIPLITLFFYLGAFVAVTLVVPLGLRFLLSFQSGTLRPMLSIDQYISFITVFAVFLGLIFEMPLIVAVLARYRILTARAMMQRRSFAYLGILVLAAVLTPPDIISQIMVGIPMIFLYETAILIAWAIPKRVMPAAEGR